MSSRMAGPRSSHCQNASAVIPASAAPVAISNALGGASLVDGEVSMPGSMGTPPTQRKSVTYAATARATGFSTIGQCTRAANTPSAADAHHMMS